MPTRFRVAGSGRNSLKPEAGQITPAVPEGSEDTCRTSPSSKKPAITGQEPHGTSRGDRQHRAATAPRCQDSTRSQQWR